MGGGGGGRGERGREREREEKRILAASSQLGQFNRQHYVCVRASDIDKFHPNDWVCGWGEGEGSEEKEEEATEGVGDWERERFVCVLCYVYRSPRLSQLQFCGIGLRCCAGKCRQTSHRNNLAALTCLVTFQSLPPPPQERERELELGNFNTQG